MHIYICIYWNQTCIKSYVQRWQWKEEQWHNHMRFYIGMVRTHTEIFLPKKYTSTQGTSNIFYYNALMLRSTGWNQRSCKISWYDFMCLWFWWAANIFGTEWGLQDCYYYKTNNVWLVPMETQNRKKPQHGSEFSGLDANPLIAFCKPFISTSLCAKKKTKGEWH